VERIGVRCRVAKITLPIGNSGRQFAGEAPLAHILGAMLERRRLKVSTLTMSNAHCPLYVNLNQHGSHWEHPWFSIYPRLDIIQDYCIYL
jgi:hypothetical protein